MLRDLVSNQLLCGHQILRDLVSNQLLCGHQIPIYYLFSLSIVQRKHTIYIDIVTEKNHQLINVSELAEEMGKVWWALLHYFYVFMDNAYTDAFKGKRKVTSLNKLMKSPRFHNSFRYLFLYISSKFSTIDFTYTSLLQQTFFKLLLLFLLFYKTCKEVECRKHVLSKIEAFTHTMYGYLRKARV